MSTRTMAATAFPGDIRRPYSGRMLALIALGWVLAVMQNFGMEFLAQVSIGRGSLDTAIHLFWIGLVHLPLWIAASLAMLWFAERYPLHRRRLLRNGALLLGAAVVLSMLRLALFFGFVRGTGLMRTDIPFLYGLIHYTAQDLYIYIALVLLAHSVRHAREAREREVVGAQLESRLVQAQLQALKVQMQPHFLFNTLNAIATLVRDDPGRAERMVEHLSEMLRITLTHDHTQEVAVRDEMATLQPYLEIEQVRMADRLAVEVAVDPEVEGAVVPHFILQPLVENAVRHGISPRRRAGRVRVVVRGEGEWVRLSVEDNGRGMHGPVRPGAIGLENIRARLRQLYGEQHRFDVESAPEQGTRVEIRVPLRTAAAGNHSPGTSARPSTTRAAPEDS